MISSVKMRWILIHCIRFLLPAQPVCQRGFIVNHRSVIDFIDCFTDTFHITENDVIGNQAPFDFDVSVKDIYSTLKTGATMQIIPKKLFSFPMPLMDYLDDRKVTTLIWAVSALCIVTTLKGFDYKDRVH